MNASDESSNAIAFQPFEGMWLASYPAGAIYCARTVGGQLLVPYSFGNPEKLTGHYFDCRVVGGKLYCRFEHFDSAQAGVMFLTVGPNHTLQGGRWNNDQLSETDQKDFSRWSAALPGMKAVTWIRILNKPIPDWAERYFREDWPNKLNL
jgi:hypothetical protein